MSGANPNRRAMDDRERKKIVELYQIHKIKTADIAARFGRSTGTICDVLAEAGVMADRYNRAWGSA